MNHRNLAAWSWIVIAALLLLGGAGCAFKVVRPPPLVVGSAETGEIRVVRYPAYVLVHDSESLWDAHQIKDNLIGLTEGEIVCWVDMAADGIAPGPPSRPVENSIEWIKNSYAQLPDCAPVRIVGGFFSALGIEKTTLLLGATRTAYAPTDPMSYFLFTRVVYLTDWAQETLGEVNTAVGYLVPWPGPFIPGVVTAPVNSAVDWAQNGAIMLYVNVFHKVSVGLDSAIDGFEAAWGGVVEVWLFLWGDGSADCDEERERPPEP
ncbi:MAG: hypothetical protein RDV41_09040 [Planctomycetota bacterium]|nr:hypothetical protein [Planctomycetota bacterium]